MLKFVTFYWDSCTRTGRWAVIYVCVMRDICFISFYKYSIGFWNCADIFRFSFYKQFFVFKYKRYITSLTHEDVIFINWKLQGRIQRLFLRREESSEMERKNNPIRLPRCTICNYLWFVHCQVCGCTLAQRSKYTLSHDRTQLCLWK